jgi:hypothetical protein
MSTAKPDDANSGSPGLVPRPHQRRRKGRPRELTSIDKHNLSVRIPREAREDFRVVAANSGVRLSALYRDILVRFIDKAPYRHGNFAFVPSHSSGPKAVQSLFRVGLPLKRRIESEAAACGVSAAAFVTTALEWARSALGPKKR